MEGIQLLRNPHPARVLRSGDLPYPICISSTVALRPRIPAFEEEVSIEETKEVEVTSDRRIFNAYILLQDIPKVLDERLREYGPFKAGDLVTLPRTVGHILVQREAAKRISISY